MVGSSSNNGDGDGGGDTRGHSTTSSPHPTPNTSHRTPGTPHHTPNANHRTPSSPYSPHSPHRTPISSHSPHSTRGDCDSEGCGTGCGEEYTKEPLATPNNPYGTFTHPATPPSTYHSTQATPHPSTPPSTYHSTHETPHPSTPPPFYQTNHETHDTSLPSIPSLHPSHSAPTSLHNYDIESYEARRDDETRDKSEDEARHEALRVLASSESGRRVPSQESKKWRHLLSLVAFVVAINVAIAILRQVGGLPGLTEAGSTTPSLSNATTPDTPDTPTTPATPVGEVWWRQHGSIDPGRSPDTHRFRPGGLPTRYDTHTAAPPPTTPTDDWDATRNTTPTTAAWA